MSQSNRPFQMLSEVTTQQIVEPIAEAMKSPSDEELDYSSNSSERYLHFSIFQSN